MAELKWSSWWQAMRPPSHIKILVPLLLGQALAYEVLGAISMPLFLLLWAYAFLQQAFIVCWNDYADVAADCQNETPMLFGGGSRVVPDGLLTPRALFCAGLLAAMLIMVLSAVLGFFFDRSWSALLMLMGLVLLWLYSFPPIKLNYRGGGEFLQGLGCGVLLPLIGYYVQLGTLAGFPAMMLVPFFILHFISSVATAIPDRAADLRAGKRTIPVWLGNFRAAWLINGLGLLALVLTIGLLPAQASWMVWLLCLAIPSLMLVHNMAIARQVVDQRGPTFRFGGMVIMLAAIYALGFCINSFAGG